MLYIIDTYAWVEYFNGTEQGDVLRRLLPDPRNQFMTLECCLAEIRGWALQNHRDFSQLLTIVRANSQIVRVTEHNWIDAALERFDQRKTRKDFGLIDATLLAKQREFNCTIISGDPHFKGLKDILFLG